MAKGWVTTARGEQLNLDQLIIESKRPFDAKDEKTEVKRRVIKKRKPLNVRGYKPATGEAKVPEMPVEIAEIVTKKEKTEAPRKVAYRDGGVAETYSDLTGVKVKPTEAAVERRKAQMAKARDEVAGVEDDEVDDILKELEAHDEEVPEKPTRRRTKKDA